MGLADGAKQERQVTVISAERWREVMAGLGTDIDPSARRANVLVSDLDLAESGGKILDVGGCKLRIHGETKPCDLMDEALPGLKDALAPDWGGGCHGEVLEGGQITVGDPVGWSL